MEIAIALTAGLFIGLVLGFVGAGGAMLAVPIMIYLLDFTPLQATTAAMVMVGLAALAGVRVRFKKGEVLVREALTVSSLGLATNVTFATLAQHFSGETITAGLAIVLALAGWSMLQKPFKPGAERKMSTPILILLALAIGAITGIFGIGGGFIAIPILVLFYNTPLAKASGTSLLIIFLNSSIAFLSRFESWGEV
ncbi:MAG: sulfite exporter TauE/SafE family protein, partial [Actinomycetota bacterium]